MYNARGELRTPTTHRLHETLFRTFFSSFTLMKSHRTTSTRPRTYIGSLPLLTGDRFLRQVRHRLVPTQGRQHAQVLQHRRRGEVQCVEHVRKVLDVRVQVFDASLAQLRSVNT